MEKRRFGYGEIVEADHLLNIQNNTEDAIDALAIDAEIKGVYEDVTLPENERELAIVPNDPTPDLNIDLIAGAARDSKGQRIYVPSKIDIDTAWSFWIATILILFIIQVIRLYYFGYKYEMYLQKKYPEKAKDLGILPGIGAEYNGFRAFRNLFRNAGQKDAKLFQLKTKVRNSFKYAWVSMVIGFLGIFVILTIYAIIE